MRPVGVQTIERTGKAIKAVMLVSGLVAGYCVIQGLRLWSHDISDAYLQTAAGAGVVYVLAQVAAWWRHG